MTPILRVESPHLVVRLHSMFLDLGLGLGPNTFIYTLTSVPQILSSYKTFGETRTWDQQATNGPIISWSWSVVQSDPKSKLKFIIDVNG